ncbi:MAG: 30S ribosomal protein S14, partial [Opitutaceae bacterium]
MPKTSAIERNKKRIRLTAKHAKLRAELKATLANPATTDEQFFDAQRRLQKLPRNSSPVRVRNRCSMSGR